MNAFTSILIFLVVGGFADLAFGNSEQSNELQQLLSEIAKSNQNISYHSTDLENRLKSNPVVISLIDPSVKRLGSECGRNRDCRHVLYSECLHGKCSCRPNYSPKNGECFGYLGAFCEFDSDCGISDSSCQSGSCKCRSDFFSIDYKTCLQYATGPNGICKSDEECKNVPNSSCSNGRCLCRSNYKESAGRCLGLINAICNNPSDCVSTNAICKGTCQCPATHYLKDGNCYENIKLLIDDFVQTLTKNQDSNELLQNHSRPLSGNESVMVPTWLQNETMVVHFYPSNSNKAVDNHPKLPEQCQQNSDCFALPYFVCSLGKCDCSQNYIFSGGKCRGLLEEDCEYDSDCFPRDSVCLLGTCQCPATHYSKDGECHLKLHLPCNSNDQCRVPYSECASGECNCKNGYVGHDDVCYGLPDAKCNKPTDCAFLGFDCKLGICTEVYSSKISELFSSKPGATAVNGPHLWDLPQFYDYRLGEPGYNPGPEKAGNLHWVRNFDLDRIALMKAWNDEKYPSYVKIYCRAKTSTGEFTSGTIQIPGDGCCKVDYKGDKFSTKNWDVLVDLGPVN